MFGMSFGEMLVLGVVAIVVVGPRNLPALLRGAGQFIAKIRRVANDLRAESGIDEILENEGIRSEIENFRRLATGPLPPEPKDVVPEREREYPSIGPDSYEAVSEEDAKYIPAAGASPAAEPPPAELPAAQPPPAEALPPARPPAPSRPPSAPPPPPPGTARSVPPPPPPAARRPPAVIPRGTLPAPAALPRPPLPRPPSNGPLPPSAPAASPAASSPSAEAPAPKPDHPEPKT